LLSILGPSSWSSWQQGHCFIVTTDSNVQSKIPEEGSLLKPNLTFIEQVIPGTRLPSSNKQSVSAFTGFVRSTASLMRQLGPQCIAALAPKKAFVATFGGHSLYFLKSIAQLFLRGGSGHVGPVLGMTGSVDLGSVFGVGSCIGGGLGAGGLGAGGLGLDRGCVGGSNNSTAA
jgi:hypothetical protein